VSQEGKAAFVVASKEGLMTPLSLSSAEPATPHRDSRPGLKELAEGCLQRNPYLAMKNVSCDCQAGVLVLRGCLPSYYLKQVAQEAVASLAGVEAVDNQIEVLPCACRSGLD
jgi:osmotically-inducible protein OsmY